MELVQLTGKTLLFAGAMVTDLLVGIHLVQLDRYAWATVMVVLLFLPLLLGLIADSLALWAGGRKTTPPLPLGRQILALLSETVYLAPLLNVRRQFDWLVTAWDEVQGRN